MLMLVICSFGGTMSCKKEVAAPDYKALLQANKWRQTSLVVAGKEAFATTAKCGQDDLRIYNADGTVTEDEGPTKCVSSDPQQDKIGTWSISADGKIITYKDSFGDTYAQTVVELTASAFKISYTDLGVTWVETYVK